MKSQLRKSRSHNSVRLFVLALVAGEAWVFVRRTTLARMALAGFAALSLAGCGWQLQGSARLPATMLAIHIDTQDAYSDFYRELRASLLAAGAQVKTPEAGASAVVHVKSDETGQRVSSISARNRPEQYDVYYRVEYSVDLSGAEVISGQQVELTATYSYDSDAVLAKQREQLSMQRALARELAGQVVRRLSSVSVRPARAQASVSRSGAGS